MTVTDEYNAATALSSYYRAATERSPARLWANEKLIHDLAAVGMLEFFEGPGNDPTGLTGYAATKIWLRQSAGVQSSAGTIRLWNGGSPASDVANWPVLTPDLFVDYLSNVAGGSALAAELGTFTPAGDEATPRTIRAKLRDFVSVKDFGAVGDGVADDTEAIVAADAYLASLGGGVLFYPPGDYLVSHFQDSLTQPVAILVSSGVTHKGSGPGATIVKLADEGDAHVFLLRDTVDSGVMDLTIDGNRANQSAPSFAGNDPCGIMAATAAVRMRLERLHVKQTLDYGIGVQLGTATDCVLRDIVIEDSGADGIDFKNTGFDSTGNRVENITVRRIGLQGETGEFVAGVDLRGQVMVNGVRVEQVGYNKGSTGRVGIRFHSGGGGANEDSHIVGGATKSSLSNFHIEGDGDAYITDVTVYGLQIMDTSVQVTNGHVERLGEGIIRQQRGSVLSNITIDECRRGFTEDTDQTALGAPLPTDPVYGVATGIVITNCTEFGMRLDADVINNTYLGIHCLGNQQNLSMHPAAAGNRFIGGAMLNPGGATNVAGGDGTNVFIGVNGYKTSTYVISDEIALDSTGMKSVAITHGLAITPPRERCSVTLSVDSGVEDFECDAPFVRATNSTTVSAKINVKVASATAGLKGRLILHVANLQ